MYVQNMRSPKHSSGIVRCCWKTTKHYGHMRRRPQRERERERELLSKEPLSLLYSPF
jgi:hypothetical protein